ncbi:hypothetical protein GQ53DRAFT_738482 [Thozetella sp. PMI_491]|nr:hypothetical protein GQ53DRAFT_738482 [Thozetella sp. PMI_491]
MPWAKKVIDFAEVRADLDTGVPTQFNTSFHTEAEAPDKTFPLAEPYSYLRWLPLILRSRSLSLAAVQTVTFSTSQARMLLEACEGSIPTGRVNLMLAEDLEAEIAPVLSKLRFPPEGLFARFDACSPKDGAHKVPGQMSLHSVDDVILRVVTSGRCRSAIKGCLQAGQPLDLFFLPFDGRMAGDREYRVFCRTGDCRITGISQYRWHKPWRFADRSEQDQSDIITKICLEAERIRGEILADANGDRAEHRLLREQGFSFDLFFDEEAQKVELVELNSFGIRSPCGSCLFQWLRDRKVLYDEEETRTVEFRVSL